MSFLSWKKTFFFALFSGIGISTIPYGYDFFSNLESGISIENNQKETNQKIALDKLSTIGYLGGYRPPQEDDNASAQPETNAQQATGFTLITSGHAPTAMILNPQGEVIHQWQKQFHEIFPDVKIPEKNQKRDLVGYWRNATLLPNGELLAIFEGLALVKLDKNSNVIWAKLNGAHHDLQVLPNNDILLLTRKVEQHDGKSVLVDYVSLLDSQGNELLSLSLLDAIKDSTFKSLLLGEKRIAGDLLHTNSLQQLDEKKAAVFGNNSKEGDILLSMRNINSIALLDPHSKKITWGFKDIFRQQHYARVAAKEGALYLFDNYGAKSKSRVLKYALPSLELLDSIGKEQLGRPFYSRTLGLVQPLCKGNLLVVESEGGRFYETKSDGTPVWKYSNPYRTGDNKKLIATIPHAARIKTTFLEPWLPASIRQ